MLHNKTDLFEHYCNIAELSAIKQHNYITALKKSEPELASKLSALLVNDSDLTQVFNQSILALTDSESVVNVGDNIANYQLTQSLGQGGMGQVFKAERNDGKIEQTVAIKFLHPLFQQYQSGQLLLQEAQALASLSHPNIASILDISETHDGNTFIVMEYIEGVTLDVYLQKNSLSIAQKLSLFNQVSDAVLEAHNHQIIHADIKPSNVLITSSGQAKLIDFGVMQVTEGLHNSAPKFVTAYLGAMTVNYASPEQLNGGKATIASDIYSLGSLLYFLLSGKGPFEEFDDTLAQKVERIMTQRPTSFAINESVIFKSDVIAILHKALSKKANERYRTVTDFISDINAFQQHQTLSVNANNSLFNTFKFIYRHRIISTALISVFMILLVAFFQINAKNELLLSEKHALENANKELKNTFTQLDKNISEAHLQSETIYLPDPNNLSSKQYIEMMMLMFDDYYFKSNHGAYTLVIDTLMEWLEAQKSIEPLSFHLAKYRKVLAVSGDSDNYESDREILGNILALKTPLNAAVLDLLRFKRFTIKLQQTHFIPLFIRLDKELVKSTLSIKELFSFHSAGGGIYADSDSEQAIYHYQKAYELAKRNTDEIKLWTFIATSIDYRTALINVKGFDDEQVVALTDELYKLIKQSNDKKLDTGKLSLILGIDLNHSMEHVADTLQKYDITFESAMNNATQSHPPILYIIGLYYASLGEYEKAIALHKKSMKQYVSDRGGEDPYLLFRVANMHLAAGDVVTGMRLIEQQILPQSAEHYELDTLGYFQTRTCKKLALIENSQRLKDLCFDGYSNVEKSLGEDGYWLKLAASGVVAWYTLQPANEAENDYVKLLESNFESNNNVNKMKYGTVLLRYYISRKDIDKAMYYQNEVAIATEADYGSVDAVIRYYHQIMVAEINLLQGDKASALVKLDSIKNKMCSLGDSNPNKVRYLELLNFLGQPDCINS
ncbi:serine/threonine-protein kinase [Psychrobium sp. 1_MG-2023]|uniref:serine/threonine-protein kinase n=1 Tax=Psychrobium sp. 1_MG-2023 TaxID=3062624 RepID=UPI000C34D7F4|nr:serine/threonine-protein kinase [Psychrobium sp. 1_MG-2023]MDP2559630.1 serine/threonine-protein kinase [Psychrobium sp. 1_MG-2023]PKF59463.1 hypothetical protein CW748_01445 [Alteromonadales bacterium alter-6D02]